MAPATETDRAAARAAARAFGCPPEERPPVHRHWDEPEDHSVAIVACHDRPLADYTTYSTLGLHHAPNVLEDDDVRIEIAGVTSSDVDDFPNLLATAAFFVIKDGWLCAPGVVFPGLLGYYDISSTLEHLLFLAPSPWPELGSVELGPDITAHWLLAVPIAESEYKLLLDIGLDEFEAVFEELDVPYFDLDREPAV